MTRRTDPAVRKELGRRIKALRKGLGFTQEEMARMCEVHWTYIGGLERGERNPTLSTLQRLADGLKVELTSLISQLKGPKPSLTERERQEQLAMKWLHKGSDAAVNLCLRMIAMVVRRNKK